MPREMVRPQWRGSMKRPLASSSAVGPAIDSERCFSCRPACYTGCSAVVVGGLVVSGGARHAISAWYLVLCWVTMMMMSWCLMSSDVIWHIRDKLWPMPKHGSIKATYVRSVYACLAVTCHLHFWQNDRDFLRATVVTRGWNGYRNKSQHRKSTLEKKILPPFQQGFEPATFRSRVRRCNHWAIPAPPSCWVTR